VSRQLKFKISSELKTLIGKELITDDYIAIFELVKNSYDANAKNVKIVFQNLEKRSGEAKIFVKDDGDGMSYDDLREKWLFVGYSEKRKMEEELKRKDYRDWIGRRRIFAGAKGIGRFSCDKLGSRLKLYTKKLNENFIHVLDVDWKKFEVKPQAEFQTIAVGYERRKRLNIEISTDKFYKGTILEISSLRSPWNRRKILRLKRHLQRLINPMQIGEQEFTIELEAKEYLKDDKKHRHKGDHEIVNGPIHNVVFERLNMKTTNITCTVDKDGKKMHTELWDKGKFIFSLEEKNEYPSLHDIAIKVFYLNKSAKISFNKLMGIPSVEYGSIFFYKNGIKINPCGNFGDDWLGLDRRKAQGVRRFFGTREVLGRIEVSGYQPNFVEASSRDGGVIKTPELELLRDLFQKKALRRLERYVVKGLGWDSETELKDPETIKADSLKVISRLIGRKPDDETKISFNKDLLKIYEEKQIEKTPEIIKNILTLKKYVTTKADRDYIDEQIKAVRNAFRNLQAEREELERELRLTESQNIFLRHITDEEKEDIVRLQHNIKIATGTIVGYLMGLKEAIDSSEPPSSKDLIEVIDNILQQTSLISSIVLYVTKASFDVKAEKIEKDLIQFVKQYVENVYSERYGTALRKSRVSINVVPEKGLVFVHRFRPLDIIMIIDNLIDNSRKAKAHNVTILISKLNESDIEIRVKDDGKGIHPSDYRRIFELGFSTTEGTGIGLYNVKKIVDDNKWNIRVNESVKKGAEFILEVRR